MLGNNIKVHFAGCDGENAACAALEIAKVNYNLYSCFPFISGKKVGQDLSLPAKSAILYNQSRMKHIIQDSGLFTLMFGAGKGKPQSRQSLEQWQDLLIQFVTQNDLKCTCVDIDCQKILGVEDAWYFRERMKKKLPNRQINVYHIEDGKEGLKSLIDFSDYIAISVPEIRIAKPKTYQADVHNLALYIKDRKPSIDIHLLGCTEEKMLQENRFCTSADSTSWLAAPRYGTIDGKHINTIKKAVIADRQQKINQIYAKRGLNCTATVNAAVRAVCAEIHAAKYNKLAGGQE